MSSLTISPPCRLPRLSCMEAMQPLMLLPPERTRGSQQDPAACQAWLTSDMKTGSIKTRSACPALLHGQ